jgi:RNA polymerase sigma-70 factor (ECF subfamily)
LATDKELSDFLKSVEKACLQARGVCGTQRRRCPGHRAGRDDPPGQKYADRPAAELPLVFQRILSNATMDWFRREKVRSAVVQNLSEFDSGDEDGDFDLLETLHALEDTMGTESASDAVSRAQILQLIDAEVAELPTVNGKPFCCVTGKSSTWPRQQAVMGCSEGSVKTHCSRAVHALAKALRTKGITL